MANQGKNKIIDKQGRVIEAASIDREKTQMEKGGKGKVQINS